MADLSQYIGENNKQPVSEKWQAVYDNMVPHILGEPPTALLEKRRPLESESDFALQYREDNFQPVTKQEFERAIDAYVKCANELTVVIKNGDDIKEYVQAIRIPTNLKSMTLEQFLIDFVSRQRQLDPNAVVATIPRHPSTEFVPRYDVDLPSFENVRNQQIETDTFFVPSQNIHYHDSSEILFNAGQWIYAIENEGQDDEVQKSAAYYWQLSAEATILWYPEEEEGDLVYSPHPYYQNNLNQKPAHIISSKSITELDPDGNLVTYYIPDFWGAAAWFNMCLMQLSDLQVTETRFTYPEKAVIKKKCTNRCHQSHDYDYNVVMTDQGEKRCDVCQGKGYIIDTTPFGTHLMDKEGMFGEDGKVIAPVMFIEPGTDTLEHSAKRVDNYYEKGQNALVIIKQNMTNQAAKSKQFDISQKEEAITDIVLDIYDLEERVLNDIQGFLERKQDIEIITPDDLGIKTSQDLSVELAALKEGNAPYAHLVEKTIQVMLKSFGDTEENRKIFEFLSLYDKLFVYGTNDLMQAKAIYGDGNINPNGLSQRDLMIHHIAHPILKEIAKRENFLDLTFDEIAKLVDEEIDKRLPELEEPAPALGEPLL